MTKVCGGSIVGDEQTNRSKRIGRRLEFINAAILGVVQGLTEFLPVSSSGHLVLIQKYLGFKEHSLSLDIAVHLGTLFSVLTIYFHHLKKMGADVISFPTRREFSLPVKVFLFVCLGSIPTAAIGLGARELFVSFFSEVSYVGVFLCITGVILFLTRHKKKGDFKHSVHLFEGFEQMNGLKALVIGTAQGLAIAPGISRSGFTIAAGLFMGLDRNVAASFSFLLSIPAILGAALIELRHLNLDEELWPIVTATLVSYVVGLLGLRGVLFFARKGRLEIFSIYLWIVGLWAVVWGF